MRSLRWNRKEELPLPCDIEVYTLDIYIDSSFHIILKLHYVLFFLTKYCLTVVNE